VSRGDFVQYQLRFRNASDTDAVDVAITDVLPFGFRYRSGSARRDEARIANPTTSSDGRTLAFAIGTVAAGETAVGHLRRGGQRGRVARRCGEHRDRQRRRPRSTNQRGARACA
jgi:uncharacterized repeat protein (TIGR01451 family)